MRSQRMPHPQAIRADARFDALVKKEMQEHQHLISSHNKEMQSLRDELRLVLERCTSLSERDAADLKTFKVDAEGGMNLLNAKIKHHEITIAEQRKTIDSLNEKLNFFHENYASKSDLGKFKKDTDENTKSLTISSLVSFQESQIGFKNLFNSLKDELLKIKLDIEKKISDAIEKGENNFSLARLDKEGIERELIRYKKAMFYIEKKIENIYTLIERINKRGELCRKPE